MMGKYNPNYNRVLDKSLIPTCNILGVDIAAINMDWILNYLKNNIKNLSGDYICVSNVHTTIMAYEDPNYLKIQNGAIMAIPDGGPLSSVGKKRGNTNMGRTTGPNLMENILEISEKYNYRHFFYGSTPETLDKLIKNIKNKYPNIQIIDSYSPPFKSVSEDEDFKIIERINNANVDFIWVGLGAPKQEIWMANHQGLVNGLMIGVGAAFDYLAGNIKRAPNWMQKCNLEWLYRLLQDPKRLFKRYIHSNIKFIWNVNVKGK